MISHPKSLFFPKAYLNLYGSLMIIGPAVFPKQSLSSLDSPGFSFGIVSDPESAVQAPEARQG